MTLISGPLLSPSPIIPDPPTGITKTIKKIHTYFSANPNPPRARSNKDLFHILFRLPFFLALSLSLRATVICDILRWNKISIVREKEELPNRVNIGRKLSLKRERAFERIMAMCAYIVACAAGPSCHLLLLPTPSPATIHPLTHPPSYSQVILSLSSAIIYHRLTSLYLII